MYISVVLCKLSLGVKLYGNKKKASCSLSYASLAIGGIYVIPMFITYLCYNTPITEDTASFIIGSIEFLLFFDFYIVTLPLIFLCIVAVVYNIYNLNKFSGNKIKVLILTIITFFVGVLVAFFALFFAEVAW